MHPFAVMPLLLVMAFLGWLCGRLEQRGGLV